MSHELDFSTGKAGMAYVGERPWHNLGTELEDGATPLEWAVAAGLDWHTEQSEVRYSTWSPATDGPLVQQMRAMPERVVLYRSDTREPLSVVSKRYQPVQPRDVLDFFGQLSTRMGFKLKTAGALKDGRRIWGMAEAPDGFEMDGDRTAHNLLLTTTYDGTGATLVTPTAVRVVCANTLDMALTGAHPVRVQHREFFDPDKVSHQMGLESSWLRYQEMVRRLSDKFLPDDTDAMLVSAYYDETLDEAKAHLQREDRGVKRFMDRLYASLETAPGADFHRGSAYALLNAVTYDVDHGRPARSDENRMISATSGEGANVKGRMLRLLEAA